MMWSLQTPSGLQLLTGIAAFALSCKFNTDKAIAWAAKVLLDPDQPEERKTACSIWLRHTLTCETMFQPLVGKKRDDTLPN